MKKLFELIRYAIFPNRCIRCSRAVNINEVLCPECLELWEKEKKSPCKKCGRSHIDCSCLLKIDDKIKIPVIYHLAEYKRDSVAGDMIISLKTRQNSDLCRFLADEFCENLCNGEDFDEAVITFVPRRKEVIRKTGSDQAYEIAKAVCDRSGKELVSIFKRKGRKNQKELNYQERVKNASSAYELISEAEDGIAGKSFFIFDDIITSGATMLACAELLLERGAVKVTAVSVGRKI